MEIPFGVQIGERIRVRARWGTSEGRRGKKYPPQSQGGVLSMGGWEGCGWEKSNFLVVCSDVVGESGNNTTYIASYYVYNKIRTKFYECWKNVIAWFKLRRPQFSSGNGGGQLLKKPLKGIG